MTPETIDKFAYQIVIDLSAIKKINVNVATAQELAAHPYIPFDLASRIVLQREQAGTFENMESLVGSGLLDGELSLKLAPYLDFK
jgi:DNA uptake protein ComE-like DNA-binding protein